MRALAELQAIAAEALVALDTGRQIQPFSFRTSSFDLDDAYQVTAIVRKMREARGELPVGRKIGFTNRKAWVDYNISEPMWGYIYDRTVHYLAERDDTFSLIQLAEPRIEPEIVFRLATPPVPRMDERTLLESVDCVAHGFEIVQSIFPGWQFSVPDAVAAFGVHAALLIGSPRPVAMHAEEWSRTLSTFEIDLKRDGTVVDHGLGTNVLGGPASALRYLIDLLARDQVNPPLAAGEIVTTGTLTRAFPISVGETWATELTGVALSGVRVRFT